MKTRIGIFGAGGRMGRELSQLAQASDDLVVAAKVDRDQNVEGAVKDITDIESDSIEVLVDFSLPEAFESNLRWCAENKVAYVSGTTGISDGDKESLRKSSELTPCLWAPNMSLGINLMAEMLGFLKTLESFDYQIVEAHHKKKIDAPSGTAKFLQDALTSKVKKDVPEPLAIRGGGIFGVHEVHVMGEEETLKIEHTALNRAVFARGALTAAKWIKGKEPGLYKMSDVLGL